jgi:hypothetical protein
MRSRNTGCLFASCEELEAELIRRPPALVGVSILASELLRRPLVTGSTLALPFRFSESGDANPSASDEHELRREDLSTPTSTASIISAVSSFIYFGCGTKSVAADAAACSDWRAARSLLPSLGSDGVP